VYLYLIESDNIEYIRASLALILREGRAASHSSAVVVICSRLLRLFLTLPPTMLTDWPQRILHFFVRPPTLCCN